MHRYTRITGVLATAAAAAAAACSDPLSVKNTNNPSIDDVFSLARDVETVGGQLYQNIHAATFNSTTALLPQLMVVSYENTSSLNNFNMGPLSGIPRAILDNSPGNAVQDNNLRDFQRQQNQAGIAQVVLDRMERPGFTLNDTIAELRLRAFALFSQGVALGQVAMVYDSASVPQSGQTADGEVPPLVGYDSVMKVGLARLDSAQKIVTRASFTTAPIPASASIPAAWLAQTGNVAPADFVRLIRAYKARLRAGVARTPVARRDSVDWAQVLADATAGLATDFTIQTNPNGGWDYAWLASHFTTGAANWHQMTPYIIGMADTLGNYDRWLATARDARTGIIIVTPDLRFPRGATRAAQQAAGAGKYFRNRPDAEDQPGAPWAVSPYDFWRWRSLFLASRIGTWVSFSKVENDMLRAEALMRLGRTNEAVPLINTSRAANGLANIGATNDSSTAVPGGNACVPKVPDPARGYTATKCGSVWEAMKWEKRMETAYASYAQWYLDGRGWGDLPEGTPIHWPVPFQELGSRGKAIYSLAGTGRPGSTGPSLTYGFGTGTR